VAELMRMYTQAGDLEMARELAKFQGIAGWRDRLPYNRHTTIRDEALAMAWVRLELMEARRADALAVANAWRDFVGGREGDTFNCAMGRSSY
jgi:hypothetical protein